MIQTMKKHFNFASDFCFIDAAGDSRLVGATYIWFVCF